MNTVITTLEEVNKLPEGAVVQDSHGCLWQKWMVSIDDGPKTDAWVRPGSGDLTIPEAVASWQPLHVLGLCRPPSSPKRPSVRYAPLLLLERMGQDVSEYKPGVSTPVDEPVEKEADPQAIIQWLAETLAGQGPFDGITSAEELIEQAKEATA